MDNSAAKLIDEALAHRRGGDRAAALSAFRSAASAASGRVPGLDIEIAVELRILDQLDDAEAVLTKILAVAPGEVSALIETGHLRRRRGDRHGSLAAFQSAAKTQPGHLGLRVEIARDLRALGRSNEAEPLVESVLAADSRHLAALIEMGLIRRARGDRAGALDCLEAATAVEPAHPGVALERATELVALGRSAEAEQLLRGVLAGDASQSGARAALARLLVDTDRAGEAQRLLGEALEADPGNVQALHSLAQIARRRGDHAGTLVHLRTAVERDPGNLDIRRDLASALREGGQIADAELLLRSIVTARPGDGWAWVQLGLVHRAAERREKAAEAFRAAESTAVRIQALVEHAREEWALGRPDKAKELCEEALAAEPANLAALVVLAEQALLGENPAAALAYAERAIGHDPSHPGLYLLAARAAIQADPAASARFVDQAKSRFGPTPEMIAAEVHFARQRSDDIGARAIVRASGLPPIHPLLWAEAASLAIQAGDFSEARRILDGAALQSPRDRARRAIIGAQLAEARRDYSAAVDRYGEALAIDPSDGYWWSERARARLLSLDTEGARADLVDGLERNAAIHRARGQSLNVSQHHLGEMLDDFAADRDVLSELKRAVALPSGRMVKRLRRIVRADPESTAAAIMLLLAMRRAGELDAIPVGRGRLRIPNQIAQFWDNAPPAEVAALMQSWHDAAGQGTYRLFDDRSAEAYLVEHAAAEVQRAWRLTRHPAQRADLFRLAWLAHEGGLYVDADDRRLAPFDTIVPAWATFVSYQENYGTIGNNVLAAVPRHPVVVRALERAAAALLRGDRDSVWLSTGPGLLTRAFAEIVSEPGNGEWHNRAFVRETHEMRRVVAIHCPAAYKRTRRHWSRADQREVAAA